MALTSMSRRSEKAEPYRLTTETARQLEGNLRFTQGGHFPIYDGDRIVGVFVSVDRFNVLLHIATLLDDPQVAAAIADARAKEEKEGKERYLSFDEVIGR